MKKLLLFFSLLLSLLPLSAAAETFEKVTDFSSLKAGDKIIIIANYVQSGAKNPHFNGWMQADLICNMTEATAAYPETQDFDFSSEENSPIITLEESGNASYPWLMNLNGSYIKSTATSKKNGIGTSTTAADACQIKFQSGTTNHEFNNANASSRKYLRANVTNGPSGTTQITSGGSSLGSKPDIYRLKSGSQEPVDYNLTLPSTLTLAKDDTHTFDLPTPVPSDLTWNSTDENVAVVIDNELMALDYGTATITASWGTTDTNFNEGTASVVVTVAKPEPVEYKPGFPDAVTLILGNEEKDYFDFVLGNKHPANISWTTSNPDVADMVDNSVLANSKGTAVVTATWEADENFLAGEASTTVNVVEEIVAMFDPASITTSIDPAKGGSAKATFEAAGKEDIAIDNFTFSSSNEAVATYDPVTGIVTLKAAGSAIITASLTEEAAKEYVFMDGANPTLTVSVADINGTIGYELVTSTTGITDEDYYVIVANYETEETSYHKAMSVTMGNNTFESTDVTISDGLVIPTENTLILSVKKTEDGKYVWTTTNREKNGNLQGNNTHSNNNLQCGSTGSTYSDITTVSFTDAGKLYMYFGAPDNVSKILLYGISQNAFKNYASSNAQNSAYAQVSLYRLNFVKAEAPIVEDFESKTEGDVVTFKARHSSHKLQYREWTKLKTVSRVETDIKYGEWKEASGITTHTHVIKNLEEVGENIAAHGVDVRAVDSRGNYSSNVGFFYNGEKTVTGIEGVAAEAEEAAELYNLQGVRVDRATAAPGLYIERRGAKTAKVIL